MAQPSNRDKLVKGAIQCLKTKGYAGTTARDVAAASDANLASIGYHFGSKEALLNEALIRILEQRNRHVGKIATGSGDDSLGFLTAMFNAATDVFKAPRPLFVAFVEGIAQAERSDELREQMAAHYRDGRQRIAEMLGASVGGRDPAVMAALLLALFDGLLLQHLLDARATASGEQLLSALVDLATPALNQSVNTENAGDGPSDPARRKRAPRQNTPRVVPTPKTETSG